MAIVRCPQDIGSKRGKITIAAPGMSFAHSRDRLSFRYLSHYRVVIAKAPRKRGPPKHPTTQQQVALWDLVLEMIKQVYGEEVAISLCESKGTAFYARDIQIMAAYGNYVSWPGYGFAPQGPTRPGA